MALKPQGNNILAGTSLAIAQIQSPDYVPGTTGWCIFQNGNAEFNSGTFRGYIVGGSLFIYNGTPGVGTLVASITSLTADPFGNTTKPGGLTIYNGPATLQAHVNSGFGAPAIEAITGVASEAEHAALYALPVNTGLANELIALVLTGAGSSHDNVQAVIDLISAAADGSSAAAGVLGTSSGGTITDRAFWDTTGFQTSTAPGSNGWYVNGTQTDASTNTNANQASATPISKAWTIPANDANVGTIYELEVPWDGVTVAGNALHIGLSIDGSSTNIVETSIIPGGISPNGIVKAKLQVLTTGSGGTVNAFIGGTLSPNASNATPSNSMGYSGTKRGKGVTFDTTASHTLTMSTLWPSSSATQTVSGYGSTLTRKGQ